MKILLYMGAMLLLLAAACSEDKGNYNYLPVNTIVEDSIEGTYTVVQFDTLTIKPYLRFSREESEDLSFEWSIEGQVISTDPVCHARIMMEPNDEKDVNNRWYDALLCITDNTTGLNYYKSFRVTVNTAYSVALYMLSEGTDGQARLSFQRRDIPDAPIVHDVFEAANPRLGKLGKKPRQVYTGSIMSKTFVVICEEGDKKMAVLNRTNLKLDKNYNEEVVMGGYSGTFTPYEIKVLMGGMVVAKEGLLGYNYMNSAALYRPIVGDYDFAHWVDCNYTMDAYLWISYDNKSEQFMRLEVSQGVAYDKVSPIPTPEDFSTKGQKFLVGGHSGYDCSRPVLYNFAEKKAYFYKILMTADEWDMTTMQPIWEFSYSKIMERGNLLNEKSVTVFGENSLYWFIANGNKIVRLHGDGGEAKEVYTAPQGEVTTMMLDAKEERLFVVAYDGSKSYIYSVGVLNEDWGKLKELPLEMEGKIVSVAATGSWKY